jgi:hypothetical protein
MFCSDEPNGPRKWRQMRWCTTENIHLDRVAALWLICRYVDPAAEFSFVPWGTEAGHVPAGVVPVGIRGAELGPHDAAGTCFAKVAWAYGVDDAGVAEVDRVIAGALAYVLHGRLPDSADWHGQVGIGLAAVSDGMRLTCAGDLAILRASMPVYDALHADLKTRLIVRRDGLVPPPAGAAGAARRLAYLRGILHGRTPPW